MSLPASAKRTTGPTRAALLEHGALLFADRGIGNVTTRQLHDAVGARNESALHYHFGGKDGLVDAILRIHLDAIESRRAALVAAIRADGRSHDLRTLVHALAAPMAVDLDTRLGRAHLRLVAQLSHPSLAYERPFRLVDAPSGTAVVRWMYAVMKPLPEPIRVERAAALRSQLISLFGLRGQLLDEVPAGSAGARTTNELFVENLLDMLVAGLRAKPSATVIALAR